MNMEMVTPRPRERVGMILEARGRQRARCEKK